MVRLGIAEADSRCLVTVQGELDRRASSWFAGHLVALGKRGCRHVVIDLSETTFIDSAGLNVLIGAMEGMEDIGGQLVLRAPPADVYEEGRRRRLGELMAIVDDAVDEAEAIERLSMLFADGDLEGPGTDLQHWVFQEGGATVEPDRSRHQSQAKGGKGGRQR